MHWDEAYIIGLDGDIWSATFKGSSDELRAHDAAELRELIRADYTFRSQARTATAAGAEIDDAIDDDDDDGYGLGYDDDDGGGTGADTDAHAQPRNQPDGVNFAAIRGERMST